MKNEPLSCSVALGSLSQAMRAQSILSAAAIPTELVKTQKSSSRRGCTYSLSFSCAQKNNVKTVLGSAKIQVFGWSV